MQFAQHAQSVRIGQPQIEQHQVEVGVLRERGIGLRGARGFNHLNVRGHTKQRLVPPFAHQPVIVDQ